MEISAHHSTMEASSPPFPAKEGENEASSAETSLSVEDSAQHGRPAEAEAASEVMPVPAEDLSMVLAQKIARMEVKKVEEKDDEKHLGKLFKKMTKDLKDQLEAMESEEKFKFLHDKFCEKSQEFIRLERSNERLHKQFETLQRDVDVATGELSRTKTFKTKLEALCKQLQKQNKQTVDDYKRAAEEDEFRSREQEERFNTSIQDVQVKIDAQEEDRKKQAADNDKLREQLKNFMVQYELRDKHFEHQVHEKELEKKLAEAKQAQAEELSRQALQQVKLYKTRADDMESQESSLREQLDSYASRYKEFEDTMVRSRDLLASLKRESVKMHRRAKALGKEKADMTAQIEAGQATLTELVESKEAARLDIQECRRAKEEVEARCRSLTQERLALREELKRRGMDLVDKAAAPVSEPSPPLPTATSEDAASKSAAGGESPPKAAPSATEAASPAAEEPEAAVTAGGDGEGDGEASGDSSEAGGSGDDSSSEQGEASAKEADGDDGGAA